MRTRLLMLVALALGFIACENQDIEFDDYHLNSVYFPFQRPARTLILGNYDLAFNDNDNAHRFEIGVTMSGVYENKTDRIVHFELDNSLMANITNVMPLPSHYYTIETQSPVVIPAGDFKGRITVQLTDAFFDDPLSFANLNLVNYAIPLRITKAENIDSVLSGVPAVENPIKVNDHDWSVLPMDYTLYGIKFINKYHAVYLRRGVDISTNANDETVRSVYHNDYVERDEEVSISTTGNKTVKYSNHVRRGDLASPGKVNLELTFGDDDNCIVNSNEGDTYNVTGTGKFVENGDSWGGKARDVIHLEYSYTDAANGESHQVYDTLVVRNRNVVFEEFSVKLQ
ncbi:DUF5627 domain-containing protein [Carboxylicivirga sp. RSCT41]|uniref:DUF5627 domain-containing protein n=1 Tax=Carboxylicivirga agarovorans TaxID=3417570 RepID=UPI003D336D58